MKRIFSTREFEVSPQDDRGELVAFGIGPSATKHAVSALKKADTKTVQSGWASFFKTKPDVRQSYRVESWDSRGRRSRFTVSAEEYNVTEVQPLGRDILLVCPRCHRKHDADIEKNGRL
jgi:hypothetical protein